MMPRSDPLLPSRRRARVRRTPLLLSVFVLVVAAWLFLRPEVPVQAATIGPSQRVAFSIAPPQPLQPLLASEAVDAPESCHARARVDLGGEAVKAGGENVQPSAAACCASCAAHADCSVWVHCGDAALCAAQLGHCWLKRSAADPAAALDALERAAASPAVGWTSGVRLAQPREAAASAARRARAERLRSPLRLVRAEPLLLGLRTETGTLELLAPAALEAAEPDFNYLLALEDEEVDLGERKHLDRRSDAFHHLGDFTLRGAAAGGARLACSSVAEGMVEEAAAAAAAGGEWPEVRLALLDAHRQKAGGECPLRARRRVAAAEGGAVVELELRNAGDASFKLSDLGMAMPFDQHFAGHNLAQVARQCSFVEPQLGGGGGYVQVTRATGRGPVLLLVPLPGTRFEAWRPMRDGEDGMQPGYMYEMTQMLMFHSAGYVADEWRAANPFNVPSSAELQPGQAARYGFRVLLAPSLREVEATLLRSGRPLLQLLPGPVLPSDMATAAALLSLPAAHTLISAAAEPAGAVQLGPCVPAGASPAAPAAARLRCALGRLEPPADGRVRLTFQLSPGSGGPPLEVTAQLFITAPAARLVALHGAHGARRAWLPLGSADPWHRDGAFFGWDAARNESATQELRVYMSGLSDEAGAAAGLAMAAKQLGAPAAEEVTLLEQYVHSTLWQGSSGERGAFLQASADYSVRLSMLYWNDALNDPASAAGRAATAAAPELARVCRDCWPDKCNWMVCWSEEKSLESWRAYNYPHVAAVYLSLYRLARWHSPPLARAADWQWYLRQAHRTALALWTRGGDPWSKRQGGGQGTAMWGVMVGSVFDSVLMDLLREGWTAEAGELQLAVEKRMRVWLSMPFPYGSEFAWDSTGHEEIATWMARFGHAAKARQTADAVTAYVSLGANWAYCGSARRWWDFTINGEGERGNSRTFHHYAAALNSIPLFEQALREPGDAWLWRLAGCAGGGTLTNIRGDGSASMGWHGDPDRLRLDKFSADFGVGFYGHAKHAGAYLSCSAELGWLCVGCDARPAPEAAAALSNGSACELADSLALVTRDAFSRRLFLQPVGELLLQLDGGRFEVAELRLRGARRGVELRIAPAAGGDAALLTLRAGGAGGERRVELACAPPCAISPAPFAVVAGERVWRVQLPAGAATLTVEVSQ